MVDKVAVNTTIGKDSSFQGRCAVKGSLRIDGHFEGPRLEVEQLYVGPSARIKTDLFVTSVVVEGVVLGNITADNRVLLLSTARVIGDLRTPELILQDGVILDGRCSVGRMGRDSAHRFIAALYEKQVAAPEAAAR